MKKSLVIILLAACAMMPAKAEEQDVECGSTVTLTATPANENYRFKEWSDGVKDNPRKFENVKDAVDLKALFVRVYNLAISANEGGAVVDATDAPVAANVELLDGDEITVTAKVTDDCYEFVGWSDGETNATRTIKASSSLTETNIVAQFARKKFKFTFSSDDDTMGTVSIAFE